MPAGEMLSVLAVLMREDEAGVKMLNEAFELTHPEPEDEVAQEDDTYAPLPGLTLKPLGVVGHSRGEQ